MTDEISPETFAYLVGLAALELDEHQAEYLRGELNHQLKAIHELEAIPLDENVPISLHGVPYPPEIRPGLRPDEWLPDPHTAAILGQAPRQAGGYIEVPDIPHTTLE
ncbi:MAG: aspartyl/glutamyl-tRNA amidotransferase subunit C [Anaerolineaceae bacterium]|jgi:aspartyl/glutamyl-tRNA(Asn/Gln) amidotransferase C subunit